MGTREANGWLSPDDLDSIEKVRIDFLRTEHSEIPTFLAKSSSIFSKHSCSSYIPRNGFQVRNSMGCDTLSNPQG